jgi:ferrous-iron efflux pump FieF
MDAVSAQRLTLKAAKAAVLLSVLLVAAKTIAWLEGGAAVMLASLTDSCMDAIVSATNYMAIRYALRPADDDHRYGHGKAEGIAALAQAAFIGGSCLFVLLEAIRTLRDPDPVGAVPATLAVLIVATLATLFLTRYQARAARKSRSLAIAADAAHYTGDIVLNLGVIASLAAGHYLNWHWIDPLAALAIAAWLLYSARAVAIHAVNMLLDREIEDGDRARIISIIDATQGVLGFHDLRTRKSGSRTLISFDIEVDPNLSVAQAHDITRAAEAALLAVFPHAEVMIHIDPAGDVSDSRHRRLEAFHGR